MAMDGPRRRRPMEVDAGPRHSPSAALPCMEGPVLAHRAKLEGDGASLPRCPWPSRGPHAPSSAGAGLRQAAVPRSSAVTGSDQQGVARCPTWFRRARLMTIVVGGGGDGFRDQPRRPVHGAGPALAPARRRSGAVRRVPAGVPAARGPARAVLRARPGGRPDRAHHLRPVERVLRRPDREEAAQPLPARQRGAVVRHRRLQPRLPVLPELGHLQVAGDRPAGRRRPAGRHRRGRRAARLPQRGVHLQRPGDLHGVRDRRRRRLPGAGHQGGRGHRRLHQRRRRGASSTRTWTPPTSTSRRSPRTSTAASRAGHLQPVLDTLEYLRHETDVWFEITTLLIPGHNDSDAEIDAECAWIAEHLGPDVPLHFTAFHPDFKMRDVPPTPPATLRRARRDRAAARAALRLHRQRPRPRGREHQLPRLRRGRGRARLVP